MSSKATSGNAGGCKRDDREGGDVGSGAVARGLTDASAEDTRRDRRRWMSFIDDSRPSMRLWADAAVGGDRSVDREDVREVRDRRDRVDFEVADLVAPVSILWLQEWSPRASRIAERLRSFNSREEGGFVCFCLAAVSCCCWSVSCSGFFQAMVLLRELLDVAAVRDDIAVTLVDVSSSVPELLGHFLIRRANRVAMFLVNTVTGISGWVVVLSE